VILHFFDAFNRKDLRTIRGFFADRHIDRTFFRSQPISLDAKLLMFARCIVAFPDWQENLDEIIAMSPNRLAVRHTGRGTQAKMVCGRAPTGRQLAATYIDFLTFNDNDRFVEYLTGNFPFTTFFDEPIVAPEHVMEARAEQGGTMISAPARREINEAYRDGVLTDQDFLQARALAPVQRRCEALLEVNLRRCYNAAVDGSNYSPCINLPMPIQIAEARCSRAGGRSWYPPWGAC